MLQKSLWGYFFDSPTVRQPHAIRYAFVGYVCAKYLSRISAVLTL